jgi:hypothetical protein
MNDDVEGIARCEACGKTQPHTVRRIDHKDAPRWCDSCHDRRHDGE